MRVKAVLLMLGISPMYPVCGAEMTTPPSDNNLSALSMEFLQFLSETQQDPVVWDYWINDEIEREDAASTSPVEEGVSNE